MVRNAIIDHGVEDGWLVLRRARWSAAEIAADAGYSVRRVQLGIAAARRRESTGLSSARASRRISPYTGPEPRLDPMFGILPFTPASVCPHRGPIERGSSFVCMVCHQSGRDLHPALQIMSGEAPEPEKRPKPRAKPKPLTRKQRRKAVA